VAAVLLRLRLAIQRHGRGSTVWVTWSIAAVLGLAGAGLVGFLESLDNGDALVLMVFFVLFIGWVVLPVTVPALQDQTVDPQRLEMYPITTVEKVSGLLLGGLVGPTALFTFLVASGGALAPDESVGVRVAVPLVSVIFVVMCVAASRALQALTVRAGSSRRGRDVVLVLTGLITIGLYLAVQYFSNNTSALSAFESSTTATILEWTPPGAAGQVNLDMRALDWADAIGGLAYALAWTVAFVGAWVWVLSRRDKGGGGGTARRRVSRTGDDALSLTGGAWSVLAPSPALASAAQFAHALFFRNARASQQVLISVVFAGLLSHSTGMEHGIPFAAALYGAFATISMGSGVLNYDGRGMEYLTVAGAPMRPVLVGKVAVVAGVGFVGVLVFVMSEAALTGRWADIAGAGIFGLAGVLWAAAVGAVISVLAPFDSEHRGKGRGRALIFILGGLGVVLGVVAGVATAVRALDVPLLAAAVVVLALAAVCLWLALRVAAARLQVTQLSVAEAVSVG